MGLDEVTMIHDPVARRVLFSKKTLRLEKQDGETDSGGIESLYQTSGLSPTLSPHLVTVGRHAASRATEECQLHSGLPEIDGPKTKAESRFADENLRSGSA